MNWHIYRRLSARVRVFYLFIHITDSLIHSIADFPYVSSDGKKISNGNNKEPTDSNDACAHSVHSVCMKVFNVIESIYVSCVW